VAAVASARPKGIRLRTSYRSEDQFVSAFHALVDESSLFVPTEKLLPASTQCYFSVELADEAPMLRGLGIVIDSWSGSDNPFKRSGVHVRVTQLTQQTEPIFERLLAAQPVVKNVPRTRKAPMTQQQWGNVVEPTTEMAVAFPDEGETTASAASMADREETVPAKPITREMVSASIPPPNKPIARAEMSAAPVAEMDEKTTETQRYDNQLRLPAPYVLKPESASAQMKSTSLPGMTPAPANKRAGRASAPPPVRSAQLASAEPRGASPVPVPVPASRSSATALPPPPAFARASAAELAPQGGFARGSSPPATTAPAIIDDARTAVDDVAPQARAAGSAEVAPQARSSTFAEEVAPQAPPMLADVVAAAPAHESQGWGVAEPSPSKWHVIRARAIATWQRVRAYFVQAPWRHLAYWRSGAWREAWWATRRTGGMLAAGVVVGVMFTLLLRPSHTVQVAVPLPVPADEHPAVASCSPAAATEVADAAPAAAAAAVTKGKPKPPPAARPASKPAAPPPKAVAVATPKPAAAPPKPVATPPKPAPAPKPAAVAAAKPAPAKPAPKSTNVASNKPANRNGCKASVPCI